MKDDKYTRTIEEQLAHERLVVRSLERELMRALDVNRKLNADILSLQKQGITPPPITQSGYDDKLVAEINDLKRLLEDAQWTIEVLNMPKEKRDSILRLDVHKE